MERKKDVKKSKVAKRRMSSSRNIWRRSLWNKKAKKSEIEARITYGKIWRQLLRIEECISIKRRWTNTI